MHDQTTPRLPILFADLSLFCLERQAHPWQRPHEPPLPERGCWRPGMLFILHHLLESMFFQILFCPLLPLPTQGAILDVTKSAQHMKDQYGG